MDTDAQFSKVKASSWLPVIMFFWLLLSILFGWLFFGVIEPAALIRNMYSGYEGYVKEYGLFCSAMFFVFCFFFLSPAACFFIWGYGFDYVLLRKGGAFVFSILVIPMAMIGMGLLVFLEVINFHRLLGAGFFLWIGLAPLQ